MLFVSVFVSAYPAAAQTRRTGPRPGYGGPLATSHAHVAPNAGPKVLLQPTALEFPDQRVGTYGDGKIVTVRNIGTAPLTISRIAATHDNFFGTTTCFTHATLAVGSSCTITTYFFPTVVGIQQSFLWIRDDADNPVQKVTLLGSGDQGYYFATARGGVANLGDAQFYGDASNLGLAKPINSMETTANGDGYWLLGSDGGIFSYGNAAFYGSTGNLHLNRPVVGMERTLTGRGYWLVASDGGVFSYGDAKFFGSTGNLHLNQPIVGMARTPSGRGYWLVARDGGVFSFGDARFFGSTGNIHLAQPIIELVPRPNAKGYWMLASDGGVFCFGDAPLFGSPVGKFVGSMISMQALSNGSGYFIAANSGGVLGYGNAAVFNDLPNIGIHVTDIVGFALTTPPLPLEHF